MTVVIRERWV